MKRLLPLLVLAVIGCSSADQNQGDSDLVVAGDELANKVTVKADRLEFDADIAASLEKNGVLAKIDAGAEPVYLVANRQTDALGADGSVRAEVRNPRGYCRLARSWKRSADGKIVVRTEQATLADAVEEIKRRGFLEVKPNDVPSAEPGAGINGRGNFETTLLRTFDEISVIDLSGKELWNKQLLLGGNAKLVLTKGRITLKPTVDAHIAIQNFIPQAGHALLTTDVQGEIEFEATGDGAYNVDRGETIFNRSVGGTVSGMPVTLTVEMGWRCSFGTTGGVVATIGATAAGSLRGGVNYEGRQLAGVLDRPTYQFGRLGPSLNGQVDAAGDCHLITDLSMQLFDAAGPQARVDLFANLKAKGASAGLAYNANGTLSGGVELGVGGTLRPFGIKIADINVPAYRFEREIFSGEITSK